MVLLLQSVLKLVGCMTGGRVACTWREAISTGWRNTYRSWWHGKGSGMIHPTMVTMVGVVAGAENEVEAAKIARSVASSSLTNSRHATSSDISPTDSHSLLNAAVYGRDPNWGCLACAAGYAEFLSTQINGNPSLHFNGSWSGQNSFHNSMSTPRARPGLRVLQWQLARMSSITQ
nr:hypothetical protein AQUCO_01000709v1 [Ipomoea trifida]